MREALFILAIILVLIGLTAYRYRKQLMFAIQIWRTLKGVRNIQSRQQVSGLDQEPQSKGELVSCSRCGKWTPVATAIKFGPTIYYCSTKCVQSKVKA
jgi:hypothetical protein